MYKDIATTHYIIFNSQGIICIMCSLNYRYTFLITVARMEPLLLDYWSPRVSSGHWSVLSHWHGLLDIFIVENMGNNKITEHRAISQRERQNSSVNRQNQSTTGKLKKTAMVLTWYRHFQNKWWVESDFTAPNLPLPLRLKGSGCHYNSIFNNTGTKQV